MKPWKPIISTVDFMSTDKSQITGLTKEAGWNIDWDIFDTLSPYEKEFLQLEFTGLKTVKYYKDRLKAIKFDNVGNILDVACGMGQWSVAMAELGNKLTGIDLNTGRLCMAKSLLRQTNEADAKFYYASMESMPVPDQSFDAVFCYGSFMFGHIERTLQEFYRVMKIGGKVYLNANTTGWYLHLFIDRGIKKKNFSMVRASVSMALKTLLGKKQNIIIRKAWIENQFQKHGFKILASGPEGSINLVPGLQLPPPTYPAEYYGQPSILEYVLEKI
jgi:ubiquinone/menaquinone biosynthesis C-methylase UbiE